MCKHEKAQDLLMHQPGWMARREGGFINSHVDDGNE
jgi:hypothetical protein